MLSSKEEGRLEKSTNEEDSDEEEEDDEDEADEEDKESEEDELVEEEEEAVADDDSESEEEWPSRFKGSSLSSKVVCAEIRGEREVATMELVEKLGSTFSLKGVSSSVSLREEATRELSRSLELSEGVMRLRAE
jgi:hypothetical protein